MNIELCTSKRIQKSNLFRVRNFYDSTKIKILISDKLNDVFMCKKLLNFKLKVKSKYKFEICSNITLNMICRDIIIDIYKNDENTLIIRKRTYDEYIDEVYRDKRCLWFTYKTYGNYKIPILDENDKRYNPNFTRRGNNKFHICGFDSNVCKVDKNTLFTLVEKDSDGEMSFLISGTYDDVIYYIDSNKMNNDYIIIPSESLIYKGGE